MAEGLHPFPPIHGDQHCPGGPDPIPCLHAHPAAIVYSMDKFDFTDGPVIDEVGDPYFSGQGVLHSNEVAVGYPQFSWYGQPNTAPFPGYAGGNQGGIKIQRDGLYLVELRLNILSDEVDYSWDFGIDTLSTSFIGLSYTNIDDYNEQGYLSTAEAAARDSVGLPTDPTNTARRTIYHTRMLNVNADLDPLGSGQDYFVSGWTSLPGGTYTVGCDLSICYLSPAIYLDA
jgi:hypothetical protein